MDVSNGRDASIAKPAFIGYVPGAMRLLGRWSVALLTLVSGLLCLSFIYFSLAGSIVPRLWDYSPLAAYWFSRPPQTMFFTIDLSPPTNDPLEPWAHRSLEIGYNSPAYGEGLAVCHYRPEPAIEGPTATDPAFPAWFIARHTADRRRRFMGFLYVNWAIIVCHRNDDMETFRGRQRVFSASPASVIILTALLPARAAWRWRNRRKARQLAAAGCCTRCGYDLRATPRSCPECGLPTRAAPSFVGSQTQPIR